MANIYIVQLIGKRVQFITNNRSAVLAFNNKRFLFIKYSIDPHKYYHNLYGELPNKPYPYNKHVFRLYSDARAKLHELEFVRSLIR